MTSKNRIIVPASPSLPLGTDQYERRYQDQFTNILRLYFNQLQNSFGELFGDAGGKYVAFPYGAFQDSTDQTAVSTTVAYPVTFNTTDFSNGVTVVSNQLTNTTNASQDVDVWFRVNGTNVPASNSRFGLAPRKSPSDPFHIIAALNYFVSLNATDYVEIVWRTTDTGVYIEHYPVSASPTRPAIPSAIATLSFVSALPT